jgi:hypothetical protein
MSDDIASLMEESLNKKASIKAENLASAIDGLQRAAELFEETGNFKKAEAITVVIEKMAGK